MARTLLVLAVLVPLVCFLLVKYQDADFVLMIYELIGENPAVALRGKVVWITGASSGIGEYLAYELAKYGCKLVLSARRKDELERVKKNCAAISLATDPSFKKDQEILVLPLDLQKFDTHEKLAQDVLKHFGKVDILVNNGARGQLGLISKTSLEVDRAILDLNTVGTISLTKAILPHMIERRKGQIVVVSSIGGKFGTPFTATYCASKHALHGYFDTARLELSEYNIGVQIICPGPVKSEFTKYAFSEDVNKLPPPGSVKKLLKMPAERFARLMAVSMANNLDEVWISENPFLAAAYFSQYFPNFFRWGMKKSAMKETRELLDRPQDKDA
ncbi:dehydrogenase/reductase SDR family member 7-like [Porites lutea]|uniref:dehydrogenase/reductase SDR family member 7-like n=1 Tax=Porites lutea TaxID=51062 RepID=UPI003CC580F6